MTQTAATDAAVTFALNQRIDGPIRTSEFYSIQRIRAEEHVESMTMTQMMDWVDISDLLESMDPKLLAKVREHFESEVIPVLMDAGDDS